MREFNIKFDPTTLKFIFGFIMLGMVFILILTIAVGHVEEKTSFGLIPLISMLGPLLGGFGGWAFSRDQGEGGGMTIYKAAKLSSDISDRLTGKLKNWGYLALAQERMLEIENIIKEVLMESDEGGGMTVEELGLKLVYFPSKAEVLMECEDSGHIGIETIYLNERGKVILAIYEKS